MTTTIEETLKNESSNNAVTEDFIRDAIDKSTVNALRLALYQATGDATLAYMKVSKEPIRGGAMLDYVLSKEDEEIVKTKALGFLLALQTNNLLGISIPGSKTPSLEDASKLMGVFCGEQLKQRELQLGYEELAFQDFPRGVTWTKQPSAKKLDRYHVVIIGAGINGISTAVNLRRLGISYTLIDRQSDVGGTWLLNTYPEARVDTLGFSFQYKFERAYKWKEMFPSANELCQYLDHVAVKHDVKKNCKFDREVIRAKWDEISSLWTLTLRTPDGREETMTANSIISASGLFATANIPDFPGINDYKGHMFHTTLWDHKYDYKNKNVAVIGTGSSGAQLIPGLARHVKKLSVYQRTAGWIAPYEGYRSAVPAHMNWILDSMPYYRNWYAFACYIRGMQLPPLQVDDPEWRAKGGFVNERNDGMRKGLTQYITSKVGADSRLLPNLVLKPPFNFVTY